MMLMRIVAPHFVAGYDMSTGNIAPIIRYMKGWSVERLRAYCQRKQWALQQIPIRPTTTDRQ